jgi:putative acetyltransferase
VSIAIRGATGGDVAAIDALLQASFPSAEEAQLVQQLCVDGDMVLTLVADDEDDGGLAGVIVFSRMQADVAGQQVSAAALAPVAVAASHRGQGVAEALIRAGIEHLADAGATLCFVLGEPTFYTRFGFAADWASGFGSPYAGDYFMALPLQGGAMPCGVRGKAVHATAFSRLSAPA